MILLWARVGWHSSCLPAFLSSGKGHVCEGVDHPVEGGTVSCVSPARGDEESSPAAHHEDYMGTCVKAGEEDLTVMDTQLRWIVSSLLLILLFMM